MRLAAFLSTLTVVAPITSGLGSPGLEHPSSHHSEQLPEPVHPSSHHSEHLPLLIWHGLGDSYDASGLKQVAELAASINPGTFVYPIRLSNDSSDDRKATFFGNLTTQLATVCSDIATHPILSRAPAVNALGFSQGGQFLRGYIERCNAPPVRSLVTLGSQHNGISRFQACAPRDWLCLGAGALLRRNTWGLAQSTLVPAQYYRDPEQLEAYVNGSNWLADINNERGEGTRNVTYAANIAALRTFAMYVFTQDQTVVPKESGWFAEVNGTTGVVTGLRNRTMYQEDWLGLRRLDEKGGLVFREMEGKHMELDEEGLADIFAEFFGPESKAAAANQQLWQAVTEISQDTLQAVEDAWSDL